MSSAYLRLLMFLPEILIPAYASSTLAFCMMYSAYKLNKQGGNIQPWCTPFPIWNQSTVPCLVLTIVSWPAYRFQSTLNIHWKDWCWNWSSNTLATWGKSWHCYVCSLMGKQDLASKLLYCWLTVPPLSPHSLPSWISNCLNLPFGAQGRSWRLNEPYFL